MPDSLSQIGQQLLQARSLLAQRSVQVAIAAFTAALVISMLVAPDVHLATSDVVRLVAIGVLATVGMLWFASASDAAIGEPERRIRLLGAGVLVALALILCVTFSIGTALVFSIGISLVTAIAARDINKQSPWALTGTLLVVVPAWVWSALDAWTWQLLLLVPICLIGIVSDGHMRAARALSPTVTSPLTSRGHRLAGWLGVLGAALLVVAVGLPTSAGNGVVALAAAGAMILVGLDMFSSTSTNRSILSRVPLVNVAMFWLAFCWIVSL